jgi:hypothetical protein
MVKPIRLAPSWQFWFKRRLDPSPSVRATGRRLELCDRHEDGMSNGARLPEEIVAKFSQIELLVSQGQSVAEAVRSIGVTEVTYYLWQHENGGLKSDQVKRLKEPVLKNQRLRKAVSELTLDKLILAEAARVNI